MKRRATSPAAPYSPATSSSSSPMRLPALRGLPAETDASLRPLTVRASTPSPVLSPRLSALQHAGSPLPPLQKRVRTRGRKPPLAPGGSLSPRKRDERLMRERVAEALEKYLERTIAWPEQGEREGEEGAAGAREGPEDAKRREKEAEGTFRLFGDSQPGCLRLGPAVGGMEEVVEDKKVEKCGNEESEEEDEDEDEEERKRLESVVVSIKPPRDLQKEDEKEVRA